MHKSNLIPILIPPAKIFFQSPKSLFSRVDVCFPFQPLPYMYHNSSHPAPFWALRETKRFPSLYM